MIRFCLTAISLTLLIGANAQYAPSNVFAHNDYERALPFYTAYNLTVGYIEADVFLQDGELMVAHHRDEIAEGRTLNELYLKPLMQEVKKNGGNAYPDAKQRLTLMIDLKTEGPPTLNAIVDLLDDYPQLTSCKTLGFMISGSVPDPASWKDYPSFITFDGRPGIAYTKKQLDRIAMISTSFTQHVKWDGRRPLSGAEQEKIAALMDDAHKKGKVFRFWATPDFPEAWEVLMDLNMDVIVTDDVEALARFLTR